MHPVFWILGGAFLLGMLAPWLVEWIAGVALVLFIWAMVREHTMK